jgi:prepilin-type N-terminal cleavage/methylation domain-containing protein
MRPLRIDDRGFTFIEIMVVLVVISIMALAVAPRMTNFFKNERENSAILTGLIAKTFDDSFLNDRINYLAIHLYDPGDEASETADKKLKDIFSRRNAVSVLRLENGAFTDNRRRILETRNFADSFRLQEVILSSGEIMKRGTVIVPFYPRGYSDDVIIHVLMNGTDRASIRIRKHMKEPQVAPEYIGFDDIDRF